MTRFVTERELCEVLRYSRNAIYKNRIAGMPFKQFGKRTIRYDLPAVLEWLEDQQKEKRV